MNDQSARKRHEAHLLPLHPQEREGLLSQEGEVLHLHGEEVGKRRMIPISGGLQEPPLCISKSLLPNDRLAAPDQEATKNPKLQDSGLVFFLSEEDGGDDQSPKGGCITPEQIALQR